MDVKHVFDSKPLNMTSHSVLLSGAIDLGE